MKKDRFLVRLVLNAMAFLIVSKLYSGMNVPGLFEAIMAAMIWGILNAMLRPILMLLTLPVNFLTFGLFTFIINGVILFLTSRLYGGLEILSFLDGIIAALLLSLVNALLSVFLADGDEKNR